MFRRPALMNAAHRLDTFDCGKAELNSYLAERALKSQTEDYSRTYIIADEDFRAVGYCSICSSMISRNLVPRQIAGHGAPAEIPVILLARLAIDNRCKGQGLGAELLKHAFQMALLSAERIGVKAMLVHALDDEAMRFYQKYKFRSAKGLDRTMLLSLKDIAASLVAASADE